jgi:uncharacterized surface protein with fasciclin (FAS1) repeats
MAEGEAMGTIVDIAAGNDAFSTLVAAVTGRRARRDPLRRRPLHRVRPDERRLRRSARRHPRRPAPPGEQGQLTAILTYHVVAGKVMAADLSDGQEVETVQGEILTVSIDGDA